MSKKKTQPAVVACAAGEVECLGQVIAAGPASKRALVCNLLAREGGASLDELVQATGWLPHSTRAALTGIRKRGNLVAKQKVDGVTRYSIAAAVAGA